MRIIHILLGAIGLLSMALAVSYALLTLIAAALWRRQRMVQPSSPPQPVTLLKPLCNAEPGLYEHLRTFCRQDFAQFQLVFGVRDPQDPALAAIQRLRGEFPALQIDVVVNPALHGRNYKISNLMNMLVRARYDVLVIADSDTWVEADYLGSVTAPLQNPAVGLVTCIYHDVPTARIWSRLGAMYVNEWYMPSVLLARLFGFQGYVSGQTLCLRRHTLEAIGSLQPLVNHLADDYRLGELVRRLGLSIVMSRYLVTAQHHETTLRSLCLHELRWMSTLRVLRPRSFRLLFLSFSLPLAAGGLLLSLAAPAFSTTAWVLFWIALGARLLQHFMQRLGPARRLVADLWLLPFRELLLCGVWAGSFFTSKVRWRANAFDVDADGIMH